MKKAKLLIFVIGITLLLPSCFSLNSGLTQNLNNHTTEVVLSRKNYNVIASVQGEAQTISIFGLGGGILKKGLIAEAKAKMLKNADIVGGAKAIINETVEVKRAHYFTFISTYTVIVSGHVIEFTE